VHIVNTLIDFFNKYFSFPKISLTDVFEILIIAFVFYEFLIWIKRTRAWSLFKGIIILLIFTLIALIFNLTTILWIAEKTFSVGVIALFIVFQPELRRALEQLGRKNIFAGLFSNEDSKNAAKRFKDNTVTELVKATFELAKYKTGALIVIEQEILLTEYERTGISLDSLLSSQLLINIFEHNTPLHDGAVIVRGDRISSATCYLPLSDNLELDKNLGTRHRAALGISEVTDSLTIIVSEETGIVSIALAGKLIRELDAEGLRKKLVYVQNKSIDVKRFRFWRGRRSNEKVADQ
jgi:diadenylate cyclase